MNKTSKPQTKIVLWKLAETLTDNKHGRWWQPSVFLQISGFTTLYIRHNMTSSSSIKVMIYVQAARPAVLLRTEDSIGKHFTNYSLGEDQQL